MIGVLSKIAIFLIYFIGKSLRVRIIGEMPKERVIFVFWHSDSFALLYIYRFRKIIGLVSTHRDGEYFARIAKGLGYTIVRGSSRDNGARALISLLRIKEGSFAFSPDGPRGPRHSVKMGVLKLAEKSKLPIVPVGVYLSDKIRFNSWDKYQLPLPLSKCIIYMGDAMPIKQADDSACETIKNALLKNNLYARQIYQASL